VNGSIAVPLYVPTWNLISSHTEIAHTCRLSIS